MTDTELKRRKAICDVAGIDDIGELSDGFHTFNGLYEQRLILFAALVKAYKDKSWKSYRHEDGEYCFGGGWFIVGIDTPEGSYTYHYENKYWDMFDCIDLPKAKHWDGHTEDDAETRLMSLMPKDGWHPFRQEQDPETGLWELVDPPADGQHILITVNMPGHEPVQEDHWYDDMYGYLDSGYTPCAEAIAWKEWPEPYVPDYSDKEVEK